MPVMISPPENWCYISGRCASLEASLLGREFFRELLREGTVEGVYARLSKSPYGELFPHLQTLYDYDRLVTDHLRNEILSIDGECPSAGPAQMFLIELGLQEVHQLLIRQGIARAGAPEVEKWAERLAGGFPWIGRFSLGGESRPLFTVQPIRALSLWADAAYLSRLMEIAGLESDLEPYVRALVALRTIEVCWRAFRSGIEIGWLENFFFRGAIPAPPMKEIAALAGDRSPLRLVRLLGPADFSLSGEDFLECYGREADDYLTRIAARRRYDTYGVARVLHYLRQLWVEHFNLRLCVSAVLTPIDARHVSARLRSD